MKNLPIFIRGLLTGLLIFLAGAGVFLLIRVHDANNAPIQNLPSGNHAETGYFDLRNTNEVLIDITGSQFTPRHILINQGTKVIWRNDDKIFHSVKFDSELNSPDLKKGDLFVHVFNKPGVYNYYCGNHPDTMKGLIVVK